MALSHSNLINDLVSDIIRVIYVEEDRSRCVFFNIVKILDKKNRRSIHKSYGLGQPSEIALLTFHNVKYYAAFKMCDGQGNLTLRKSVPTL